MKKIFIKILLTLLTFGTLYAQSDNTDEIIKLTHESRIEAERSEAKLILEGNIDLYNERYPIDFISIAELNKQELRILRNLIFARYGYSFKSNELTSYFNNFEWYKAKSTNVNDQLNYADKRNIEIIRTFESMDKSQPNIINTNEMVGLWHASLIMPSGFYLVFQFYKDGSFTYRYSQMRQLPEIDKFSGSYEIDGNVILLTITQTTMYEHTEDVDFSGAFGYQWSKSKRIFIDSNETLQFPIEKIQTIEKAFSEEDRYPPEMADREVLTIGNVQFFKYSENPDDY
ncbi:YARHG domain-containing protein [Oceanispirochaeta crateris]|uniref:YARHG domain-containing protein n=1 Tax=Oceanispirochaeta crateris TaxID=2518645 RepID=A0A5C1QJ57_9SPIO|nr:YARHG domain-containing protein [Oceanispirochaeta crateris]QEN08195.1 YARHG domain-containing protein [Oceanispirochaeta crateris]